MLLHRRRAATFALSLTLLGLALGCTPVSAPTFGDDRNNGVGGINGGAGTGGGTDTTSADPTPAPTATPQPPRYGTVSWTTTAQTLSPVANLTAGAVVNGAFVVVGGQNDTDGLLNTVSSFPVAGATVGARQVETTYPEGVCSVGAYAFGTDLLVAGGQAFSTGYTANLVKLLTGGTWLDTALFPTDAPIEGGRQDFGAAQTDAYAYVVGGNKGGLGTTVAGNPTADILVGKYEGGAITSWTKAGDLPAATLSPAAVVANGRLYVFGGQQGSTNVGSVYSYPINADGTLGTRQDETSALETTGTLPGASGAAMFAFGNNLYLAGGMGATGPRAETYISVIGTDGKLTQWKAGGSLPDKVARAAAGTDTAGHFYLAGGAIEKDTSPQGGEANDRVYVGTAVIAP